MCVKEIEREMDVGIICVKKHDDPALGSMNSENRQTEKGMEREKIYKETGSENTDSSVA